MVELKDYFNNKLTDAIQIIKKYNLDYYKIGLFGSLARGTFNANSDIDIAIIVNELPPRLVTADLRCDLDDIKVDLAILLKSTFENPNSTFSRVVVRDFKEIKI